MSGITGRLVKGSLWITLSRVLVNGLATLSTFILAWLLLPSDFGVVALGTTVLYIVTSVTEFSLNAAVMRLPDPTSAHLNTAWSLNVIRGLGLFVLVSALAWPLARWFGDNRLLPIVIAQGFGLFAASFANPRLALAQRDLIFRPSFLVAVGQKLVGVVAAVSFAIVYQSYWALVVGSLATQLTGVVLSYILMPYRPRISFRHTRDLLGFSGWLSIGWTVSTLNWRFDELLIGKLLGGSALGYYSMGSNLAMMPTREVTAPLTNPIYAGFARLQNDRARLKVAYQRSQSLVAALTLPVGVGVAIIADPLVRLALGDKWLSAVFIIQALASIFAIQVLGTLCQPLAMALGETRRLFVRDTQLLAFAVPLISVGAFFGGLKGIVVARAVMGLITVLANMNLVKYLIDIDLKGQMMANFRAILGVMSMTVVGVLIQYLFNYSHDKIALTLDIGLSVFMCAFAYFGVNAALWVAARRPSGPETEVLNIVLCAIESLSRQKGAA